MNSPKLLAASEGFESVGVILEFERTRAIGLSDVQPGQSRVSVEICMLSSMGDWLSTSTNRSDGCTNSKLPIPSALCMHRFNETTVWGGTIRSMSMRPINGSANLADLQRTAALSAYNR